MSKFRPAGDKMEEKHTSVLSAQTETEEFTRVEFIICALCTTKPRTPLALAASMDLPLTHIRAKLADLIQRKLMQRRSEDRFSFYASYLTSVEMRAGFRKWADIPALHPEIAQFYDKRLSQAEKNREENGTHETST